ncbi:hypothetical protein LIER_24383 [Lithospermum erythrorhizon]|uniref:Uncharacterized protein n=1 Tax=Lithospermum erythrorhizon TaxID=34254 RepID=A0AAV3R212_LITER
MTGDQKCTRVCYQASVPLVNPGAANQDSRRKRRGDSEVNTMMNKEEDNSPNKKESLKKAVPHEEVEWIPFSEKDQEKTFRVGTKLDKRHTTQLIELIREFACLFMGDGRHAWRGPYCGPPSPPCRSSISSAQTAEKNI